MFNCDCKRVPDIIQMMWNWGSTGDPALPCGKILRSPARTDTPTLKLHTERLSLRKPWRLGGQVFYNEGYKEEKTTSSQVGGAEMRSSQNPPPSPGVATPKCEGPPSHGGPPRGARRASPGRAPEPRETAPGNKPPPHAWLLTAELTPRRSQLCSRGAAPGPRTEAAA